MLVCKNKCIKYCILLLLSDSYLPGTHDSKTRRRKAWYAHKGRTEWTAREPQRPQRRGRLYIQN